MQIGPKLTDLVGDLAFPSLIALKCLEFSIQSIELSATTGNRRDKPTVDIALMLGIACEGLGNDDVLMQQDVDEIRAVPAVGLASHSSVSQSKAADYPVRSPCG